MMKRPLFGWSLPPGVRSTDIPGNRPGDEELEVTLTLTRDQIEHINAFDKDVYCWDEAIQELFRACAAALPEPPDHPTEPKR